MRRRGLATAGVLVTALIAATPASAAPPHMEYDTYRMSSTQATLVVPAPGVLANDTDPDGDPLTAALLSGPAYGTLEFRRSGRFTYTPEPGFSGLDEFTYSARDNPHDVLACCGHVYVIVSQPPQAADDAYSALSARTRTVTAPGVLANDTAERVRLADPPDHGTVDLRGTGRFDYTADPGFVGADTFTYDAINQGEARAQATVTMRVKASNTKPQAVDDTFETDEDTPLTVSAPGLLANDIDADADPLTALAVTQPFGDGFTMGADGSFEYYPPPNFDSPVTFTYRVDDGLAQSEAATVHIEIHAVDDSPTAQDDEYSLGGATTLDVPAPGVFSNDYDEVEGDSLSLRHRGGPRKGTLDLRPDGSFTYVRDPGEHGQDRFRYQLYDSGGAQGNIAYVYIRP